MGVIIHRVLCWTRTRTIWARLSFSTFRAVLHDMLRYYFCPQVPSNHHQMKAPRLTLACNIVVLINHWCEDRSKRNAIWYYICTSIELLMNLNSDSFELRWTSHFSPQTSNRRSSGFRTTRSLTVSHRSPQLFWNHISSGRVVKCCFQFPSFL